MTGPTVRGTLRRAAVVVTAALGLGLGLSACGDSGTALAKQACVHVDRSIGLFKRAGQQSDVTEAAQLEQRAYIELRDALPIAAQAAYADGQWQALMTTLSETNRVPEATLTSALTAQCAVADRSTFDQPPPPSSIPPPAPLTSSG
ncbi:MAG TPA: hypothetical protein VND67_01800 [Acidimicrobiales bacterium]|nr:hypothetical protein [Acidimicrobiales bacterium]